MAQCMQLRRYVLRLQLFKADTVGARPMHPIVGMVQFHPNIAHQPTSRHILTRMTGKLGFGEVLCHVQSKLFHDGPTTDQVVAQGLGAERVIAHALVQFVFDNAALALATVQDQLLCPGGVT